MAPAAKKTPRRRSRATSTERVPAAERARRSGFPKKLDAWLTANDEVRRAGAVHYGPASADRLARVLTAQGESVNPGTVVRWRSGQVLPESRYVALLERLLGAPWTYLDDPETPWPRPWTKEAVADLLQLLPDSDVEDLGRELQQALERHERRDGSSKPR